jgi:hypothetical protein
MVLTCFTLLMPAFSLRATPPVLAGRASMRRERSPTTQRVQSTRRIPGFGTRLEPRYIIRAEAFDQ